MSITKEKGLAEVSAKPRDRAHDIAKGICILLVLQVHIFNYPEWFRYTLAATSVWLMPFFFTLSGYYYRPGVRRPAEALRRRAVQLLKPYFTYSIGLWLISTAYNLIRHSYTLWECVRQYLMFLVSRNTFVLFGLEPATMERTVRPDSINFIYATIPFWFVAMMFLSYVIFYFIADYALSNAKRFISVTTLLIIITYVLNLCVDAMGFGLPWNCQNVPMGTALMLFGAMFGKYKILSKDTISTKWKIINSLVALVIIFGLQMKYNGIGSFASGIFINFGAIETFPCVVLGILSPFMMISFSRIIDKIPVLNKAFSWVGFRTIPFLFVHLTVSSLITELLGIRRKSDGGAAESLLNLLLTIVILVIYRIVWEFILKKINTKKKVKVD